MRKYLLLLLVCAFTVGASTLTASPGTLDKSECIVSTAKSQIGVMELTGKNDGPEVEAYLAVTALGKGYPWCAAFVSWTLVQCDVHNPKSAWSPSWFPNSKTIYTKGLKQKIPPQPGDVLGLYYSNLGRIGHVGIVEDWGESWCVSVEGNTNEAGSRSGDGVYRKRRLTQSIYKVSRWV